MVKSKNVSTLWHIPRPNGLRKKMPEFLFFVLHYFLIPLVDTISIEPSPGLPI